MALPLFLLPGIGADERLFEAQRAVRDIRVVRWIEPADRHEPLRRYAERLARRLSIGEPFDLGGASFGGMIALELARHLAPRRVFLFGSCRSRRAVAPALRMLRRLAPLVPDRMLRPPRWVARWFGATSPAHVHGNRDRLIPVRRVRPDRVIRGAGHLLNITHADAVNDFLATAAEIPT